MTNVEIKNWIEKLCTEDKNDLILKHIVVNIKELQLIEDELFNENMYLPVKICECTSKDYVNYLKINGLYEKFEDKINKVRRYTQEECLNEFIDWINNHEEYSNLLNVENYDVLVRKLNDIDNEYTNIFNSLK